MSLFISAISKNVIKHTFNVHLLIMHLFGETILMSN